MMSMSLEELKLRLKMAKDDTSQDEYLTLTLEDVLDYIKVDCNQEFEEGLPSAVKMAAAKIIRSLQENSNVASQSLGDMSKSFFEGATMKEAKNLYRPFVKPKGRFL
ncbi:hypothetical protein EVU96_24835 [Bacillus infantis]|uniref:phage head-tail connector protein n=1 Tax=Bacillus infantis TaxID=324767 RepID=UPI00101C6B8A|nr:phage head-tail connector protein [Bacillus infantis]RYI25194.1 hypothetical protein EVU96_24835 [Bacillus infantis]